MYSNGKNAEYKIQKIIRWRTHPLPEEYDRSNDRHAGEYPTPNDLCIRLRRNRFIIHFEINGSKPNLE